MAWMTLHSDVTIGNLRITEGVSSVRIRRGMHGYNESAIVRLPAMGYVLKRGQQIPVKQSVSELIAENDAVTIQLGYGVNGGAPEMKTEWKGFVKRRNKGNPLEIECEGYARRLRLDVSLNKYLPTTTAKELLELACKGTGITVVCPVNFPLTGIHLLNADGCKIIDHIKKCSADALKIFFLKPDVLWCGLPYTPYIAGEKVYNAPEVNYRIGWNVVRDNNLKQMEPSEPVQIIINGLTVTGDSVRTESKDKVARRKEAFLLNNVPDSATLKSFANELAEHRNYKGYQGTITAFLQPYCDIGYTANVTDAAFPERNGKYLVESIDVQYGVNGARRNVELGPRIV